MPGFNRLSHQILLVFAFVVIVSLAVSGWYISRISVDISTSRIGEGDQQLARRVADAVGTGMARAEPVLRLLVESHGVRLMEAAVVRAEIARVREGFPEITSVYVASLDGEQIARTDDGELENVSKLWSFQVAKTGEELVSDVYPSPMAATLVQTITLPITDSGSAIGVLSAEISFRSIAETIADVELSEGGTVVVVASNGRVVAHTYMEQVRDELDLSSSPVVRAVLGGQEGFSKDHADEAGRPVLASYAPVLELGWGVVVQRPLADIDAEVGRLRTTTFVAIGVSILFAAVVGWLMAGWIARPIRKLAGASGRIALGDLSTPVEVKSSNEIGVLAHSFNQMMASLQESRATLEQRVADRTSQLEERSEELASTNLRLEEASRAKSEFLANMSHELRTPLNSIIGYTKLILDGIEGEINEEQRDDLQIVHASSAHLLQLINDLLDVSKIEARKVELSYQEFAVSDLLAEVLPTLEPLAKAKGLVLTSSVAPGIDHLHADKTKMKQVLINLLGNAVKFTNEGSVALKVWKTDTAMSFSVTDTGIGIKEEDLEAIFDSFQQAGPAQIAGYEGTGLGLTISKHFLEMHGGSISAESEPGKGSTFTFTLPIKETVGRSREDGE